MINGDRWVARRSAFPTRTQEGSMPQGVDDGFYDRANAHIHLSNDQASDAGRGKVSASMMYGTSRFNAWMSACGFESAEQMRSARSETIRYFVEEYEKMLVENLDDYIANFDRYMKQEPQAQPRRALPLARLARCSSLNCGNTGPPGEPEGFSAPPPSPSR